VPLVNAALLSVADELNIPLLVVTTDIDVSAFCLGLPDDLQADQDHFRITIPYAKEPWDGLFSEKFSPAVQTCFHYAFGYPTRRAFSEEPSTVVLNQLREQYEIQKDEQLILIMMGGNAGRASEEYAHQLLKMSDETLDRVVGKEARLHLLCLCGDTNRSENRAFMEGLNDLNKMPARVRIHGVPATSQIAQLVSLPELFLVISKPGGSSVNEMIKKRVFMIYHTSSIPLDWEKGNSLYGEARGYGKQFVLSKQSPAEFTELLVEAFAKGRAMRSLEALVPEAKIDFADSLRQSVQQMLEKKERIQKNKEYTQGT
jgi:UDP-N-acetylglucosamine:LPS N-acetylglucosamine transferase